MKRKVIQKCNQDNIVQCSVTETSSTVMLDAIQYFEILFFITDLVLETCITLVRNTKISNKITTYLLIFKQKELSLLLTWSLILDVGSKDDKDYMIHYY